MLRVSSVIRNSCIRFFGGRFVGRERIRELQEIEQCYRAIIHQLPWAASVIDTQGRFLERNHTAEQISGIPRDALLGKPFMEVVHPDDRIATLKALSRVLRGEATNVRYRLIRNDGDLVYADSTGVPIHLGNKVSRVFVVTRDITRQSIAERQLSESEAKYRSLFEHCLDGILLLSGTGTIIAANPAALHMVGYDENELIGEDSAVLFKPAKAIMRRLCGSGTATGEYWCRRSDGTAIPMEGTAAVFHVDEQAEPSGKRFHYVSVVFRDISERERTERELRASREDMRRLWAFVHSVREEEQKRVARELHDDLGQLVTALKLDLGWLKRGIADNDDFLLGKVADLEMLVDETLDAQRRLLQGLRPRTLDELGLVAACEWLVEQFERNTGVRATLETSHREFCLSDEVATALFRIVQEALTNVARHAGADSVKIVLDQQEDDIRVSVNDDGTGFIPMQSRGRECFGLLGMRERAHLLDAVLSIISAPGEGTEIVLTLPLSDRDPKMRAAGDQQRRASRHVSSLMGDDAF